MKTKESIEHKFKKDLKQMIALRSLPFLLLYLLLFPVYLITAFWLMYVSRHNTLQFYYWVPFNNMLRHPPSYVFGAALWFIIIQMIMWICRL